MAYESAAKINESNEKKANRDPITGAPGSHPVGTGLGAAVGSAAGVVATAAMGALTGAALGPIGVVAGIAAGGILGGGVGHAMGEDIYPTQIAWWKDNYTTRPYAKQGVAFDHYEPAYRSGIQAHLQNKDADFANLEPSLRNNWNIARDGSQLEWDDARPAAQDAFDRMRTTKNIW